MELGINGAIDVAQDDACIVGRAGTGAREVYIKTDTTRGIPGISAVGI